MLVFDKLLSGGTQIKANDSPIPLFQANNGFTEMGLDGRRAPKWGSGTPRSGCEVIRTYDFGTGS